MKEGGKRAVKREQKVTYYFNKTKRGCEIILLRLYLKTASRNFDSAIFRFQKRFSRSPGDLREI